MGSLKLYNSLGRTKQEFIPVHKGIVNMYNCGPTVYFYAHIGNYRSFVFADFIKRYLEFKGFEVNQVMNLTDVGHMRDDDEDSHQDKVVEQSKKENLSPLELSRKYEKYFFEDLKTLRVKPAMKYPRASEHIPQIISMIQTLLDEGFAYQTPSGVYFDVTKFKEYGKLSGNTIDKLMLGAGGRVSDNGDKRNHQDFVLWVIDSSHALKWDSPFGKGYPGWHIECSVMCNTYLGNTIDIHTGGEDNLFPHHEAEIAQSESANHKPFAKYWLHVKHLQIEGQKMSKSLGNIFTISQLLEKGFSGKAIRFTLLSNHYRQQFNFTFSEVEKFGKTINNLELLYSKILNLSDSDLINSSDSNANSISSFEAELSDIKNNFFNALDDDFNVPIALTNFFDFVSLVNKKYDSLNISKKEKKLILDFFSDFNSIFYVFDFSSDTNSEFSALLEERENARKNKDWARADEIRDLLKEKGFVIVDTKTGPVLQKV